MIWKKIMHAINLGLFGVLYYTFLAAWLSPAKIVLVSINAFNEATIEFIVLTMLLILNAKIVLDWVTQQEKKKEKKGHGEKRKEESVFKQLFGYEAEKAC